MTIARIGLACLGAGFLGVACGGTSTNGVAGSSTGGVSAGGNATGGLGGAASTGGVQASGGVQATGGGQATGGTAGTGTVPPTPCLSDKDCKAAAGVCDTSLHACVGCVEQADCSEGSICSNGSCVVTKACTSSTQCADDEVCSDSLERCVECEQGTDCTSGKCFDHRCVEPCSNDECAQGTVCVKAEGFCAECETHADCPASEYCRDFECVSDLCDASSATCMGGSLATCGADGDRWSVGPCADGCDSTGAVAVCSGAASCGPVIDDFEDKDGSICNGSGRIGSWFTWGEDQSPNGVDDPIAPVAEGRGGGYAMKLSFPHYAGIGFDLQKNGTLYGTFDASAHTGIQFWIKSTAILDGWDQSLLVNTAATTAPEYGGTCTSACAAHTFTFAPSTDWTLVKVSWATLGLQPTEVSALTNIQLSLAGNVDSHSVWIDDVAFY